MKFVFLLVSLFSFSTFAGVPDRMFKCESLEGVRLNFQLNLTNYNSDVYKNNFVVFDDGRSLEAKWISNSVSFDGYRFYFKSSPENHDSEYGFSVWNESDVSTYPAPPPISEGKCKDMINDVMDFWPYENSEWELVKLTCLKGGKSLPPPTRTTKVTVKVSSSKIFEPFSHWYSSNFVPSKQGRIYMGYSGCSGGQNFSFQTNYQYLSTNPRSVEMEPPLYFRRGTGSSEMGTPGTCDLGEFAYSIDFISNPLQADRENFSMFVGSSEHCPGNWDWATTGPMIGHFKKIK